MTPAITVCKDSANFQGSELESSFDRSNVPSLRQHPVGPSGKVYPNPFVHSSPCMNRKLFGRIRSAQKIGKTADRHLLPVFPKKRY